MTPLTARFAAKPGIIATDLETELVLLDPESQEMFRLNQSGRAVWLNLGTRDVAGLVSALVDTFAVTPEQAERDVQALINELVAAGLIVPAPSA